MKKIKETKETREEELIDFALAELEKTFDSLNKGKKPEFSKQLSKLITELGKVSDKEMSEAEVSEWTEKTAKKIGLE